MTSGLKTDIKVQDWSQFEEAIAEIKLSNTAITRSLSDELKSKIVGENTMTDRQHRKIIALFVCELNWQAIDAYKFIVKNIPGIENRLSKKARRETELSELYIKISKTEAYKLIHILKCIAGRKKK